MQYDSHVIPPANSLKFLEVGGPYGINLVLDYANSESILKIVHRAQNSEKISWIH